MPSLARRSLTACLPQPIQNQTLTELFSPSRLAKLVAASPVAQRANLPALDADRIARLGAVLEGLVLAREPNCDVDDLERRVYSYYIPVYLWACGLLARHQEHASSPMNIGFSCPQGGGKTTMVTFLGALFKSEGITCAGASLDDFYLTYEQQCAVGHRYEENGLLKYRGNPGTHDVGMLCRTMDEICKFGTEEAHDFVEVPQYDKTQHGGRGDRKPMEKAEKVRDCEVFLLEGWCMGFKAKGREFDFEGAGKKELRVVDKYLEEFDEIYKRLHGLLVVEVDDLDCVYEWREQPEKESREAGKGAMSVEEVKDFVDRFMDSYKMYTPDLYDEKVTLLKDELHIKINRNRQLC